MTDSAAGAPAINLSPREKLEILGAILLALFLFALDQTVVGTALPKIITDLKGNELYTWSVTIYLLTSTISGPIYGKLSDLFGRRPIVIWAVGLFLVSSVFAGLSQQMWQFILFRGLQGLGGGAVFPVALAVVADLYTPAERGKYLGFFGAVFGVSSLVGPAIGGIITDQFSWHWIFFVNVPIGLVSLVILWRLLPAIRRPEAARNIDYVGALVFALAIAPFLVGLTNKQTGQWADPAVGGLMLVGLAFGALFIWIESRVPEPIVPLALFRIRTFTISVAAMFLAAFGFFTAVIFLPRWFQTVAGASATESGYNILPLLFGLIVSAIARGPLQDPDLQLVAAAGAGALPVDEPACQYGSTRPLALDAHRRRRDRAVVRGLHADCPELGPAGPHRRRHEQPDVLPADRRNGGPHAGQHDPREPHRDRAADPARQGRRAAPGPCPVAARRSGQRGRGPVRDRRPWGADPCRGAGRRPAQRRAADPGHRRRCPRGVHDRACVDVLDRHRRRAHRRGARLVPPRGADARDVPDGGAVARPKRGAVAGLI
ncbi:MAG: MFS transporter [Chloroflexi bacterium]|nr:MAG: MFS transporter [Chloroflexota bacterium]